MSNAMSGKQNPLLHSSLRKSPNPETHPMFPTFNTVMLIMALQKKYVGQVAPTKAITRRTQTRWTSPSSKPNRRASRRKRHQRSPKLRGQRQYRLPNNMAMTSTDVSVAISARFGDAK